MNITIKHTLTKQIMLIALLDHYYGLCGAYTIEEKNALTEKYTKELKQLSKKNALKIVKTMLYQFGRQGEHSDGFFDASFELGEERKCWVEKIEKWIFKHYTHLYE